MMGAVRLMQKHVFGCKGLAIAMPQKCENTLYNGVLCVRKPDTHLIIQILLDEALKMGFCTFNVPHYSLMRLVSSARFPFGICYLSDVELTMLFRLHYSTSCMRTQVCSRLLSYIHD